MKVQVIIRNYWLTSNIYLLKCKISDHMMHIFQANEHQTFGFVLLNRKYRGFGKAS